MKKPSLKQKIAFEKTIENHGNVSKSMREAGYSEATAKNPKNLTESKGWDQLLSEISDDLLKETLLEGLESVKPIGASILVNKEGQVIKAENEGAIEVPDNATRHKYLDTALKLKDKYPAEKHKHGGDPDNPIKYEIEIIEDSRVGKDE